MLLVLFVLSSIITPPGEASAMEAFAQGRLNLVYIGEQGPADYRDDETGMLLESLGCVWEEEKESFVNRWNSYMLQCWSSISSDSTYFVVRTEEESLEYRDRRLVYRDSWGYVPVEIFPEDFSALIEVSSHSLRDSFDHIAYLEIYTPLQDDTLRTEIPIRSDIITLLLSRGRREIQRNQLVD